MNLKLGLLSLLFPALASANVLGDMQTFQPNTDGLDFITVHTGRALPKGFFVFSNYLNYAKDHLLVYKTLADQDRIDYEDSLFEYDFGIAYGLTDNLQLSFQMPVLLSHSTEEQEGVIVNISEGIHSFRPGAKYSHQNSDNSYWAFLGSIDLPFLENSPYTGTEVRPIFNLEGAYSWNNKTRIYSVNAGARIRNPSDTPSDAHMFPLKSQFTTSFGVSDKYSSTARWVFEAIGSVPLDKDPYKETIHASSIDLLLGMKHRWVRNLNFDWGATIEPAVESLSPKWRVFAGLVYFWKPGSNSESAVTSTEADFNVLPNDKIIKVNEYIQYYAENDVQIASCEIEEGPGTLNRSCEYSSDVPGYARLIFRDDAGRTVTRMVTIQGSAPADKLSFTMPNYEVFTGSSIQVEAQGGVPYYRYKISKGQGTMSDTGFFEAPLTPQTIYIFVTDSRGTVAKSQIKVVAPQKADTSIDLTNLEFVSGTADLTQASLARLRKNLGALRSVNVGKLLIEGHTDSVGSDDYNQRLSRRRSETVKNLLSKEIPLDASKIDAIGYGESRPIASNDTPAGRQKNRRVVLKVYYKK